MDVSGIVNIADIAGIADIVTDIADIVTDIAGIADRVLQILRWKQVGVYKVSWGYPVTRLINALAIFQKRINSILGEHLNKFIIAYLDNIIIYFNSKEEYF